MASIPVWVLYLTPRSAFFDYASVDSVQAIVGKPLIFQSTRQILRPLSTIWTDILYCRNEKGEYERRFSSTTLGRPRVTNGYEITPKWIYNETAPYIPVREETCRLENLITGTTFLGITKEQFLVNYEFQITTEENKPEY